MRVGRSLGNSPDWLRELCATGCLETPDGARRARGPASRRMEILVPGAGGDAVHLDRVDGLTAGRAVGPREATVPRAGEDRREAPGKPPGPAVTPMDLAPVPGETLRAAPRRSSQQPRVAFDHPCGVAARREPPVHRPIAPGERGGQQATDLIPGEASRPGEGPQLLGLQVVQQPHGDAEQHVLLRPPARPVRIAIAPGDVPRWCARRRM